jgi:hypothetical protein
MSFQMENSVLPGNSYSKESPSSHKRRIKMKKISVLFVVVLIAALLAPIPTGQAQAKALPTSSLSQLPLGLEPAYLGAIGAEQSIHANGNILQAQGGGLDARFSPAGVS